MSDLTKHIILNDLKKRGIENYIITEEVLKNPKQIKVGQREIIYVHLFNAIYKEKPDFYVELISKENKHTYKYGNVLSINESYNKSNIVKIFESTVTVTSDNLQSFFIQFYKVTY